MNKVRICLALVLLSLASVGNAAQAVTTGGYLACLSEQWLDDIITFAVSKDTASVNAYMESGKCIVVKAGLKVTLTDAGWTVHEFVFQGVRFWTPVEGLKLVR